MIGHRLIAFACVKFLLICVIGIVKNLVDRSLFLNCKGLQSWIRSWWRNFDLGFANGGCNFDCTVQQIGSLEQNSLYGGYQIKCSSTVRSISLCVKFSKLAKLKIWIQLTSLAIDNYCLYKPKSHTKKYQVGLFIFVVWLVGLLAARCTIN